MVDYGMDPDHIEHDAWQADTVEVVNRDWDSDLDDAEQCYEDALAGAEPSDFGMNLGHIEQCAKQGGAAARAVDCMNLGIDVDRYAVELAVAVRRHAGDLHMSGAQIDYAKEEDVAAKEVAYHYEMN